MAKANKTSTIATSRFIWIIVAAVLIVLVLYNMYSGITVEKLGIPGVFMVEYGKKGPARATTSDSQPAPAVNIRLETKGDQSPAIVSGGDVAISPDQQKHIQKPGPKEAKPGTLPVSGGEIKLDTKGNESPAVVSGGDVTIDYSDKKERQR